MADMFGWLPIQTSIKRASIQWGRLMTMAEKKLPIEWWEGCLRNRKINLEREVATLLSQEEKVARLRLDIEFEESRIKKAKSNGRDSYSDNYGKSKK